MFNTIRASISLRSNFFTYEKRLGIFAFTRTKIVSYLTIYVKNKKSENETINYFSITLTETDEQLG